MCAEVAVRWPERVRRMALINAVGLYVEGAPITEIFGRRLDELAGELYADPDFPVAQLMREMAKLENDPSSLPFELLKPVIQAQAATAKLGWNPYLHDPKLRGRLERISAPTLLVHGRSDRIVPRAHAVAYAQGIRNSRISEVDKGAHLCAIECPEEVAELVAGFLDE
jgi:pimeloyl-ACP methyl ester carboxylesterase